MQFVFKPNIRKFFNLVFGLLLLTMLYFQTSKLEVAAGQWADLAAKMRWAYLFIGFILVLPNYYLEIYKWQILSNILENRNFKESTIEVLRGLRLGLFTPLMIGDFVGRSIDFQPQNRGASTALNFFNRITQTWTAMALGAMALSAWYLMADANLKKILLVPALVLVAASGVSLVLLYRNPRVFLKKFTSYELADRVKTKIITLSVLRSLLYNVQYVFFFLGFGIVLQPLVYFMGINIILLVKTIGGGLNILGDLSLRELVSLNFFNQFYQVDGVLVILATFAVWFVNIFSPALFGLFLPKKMYT